jgi:hypothetical protein
MKVWMGQNFHQVLTNVQTIFETAVRIHSPQFSLSFALQQKRSSLSFISYSYIPGNYTAHFNVNKIINESPSHQRMADGQILANLKNSF